MCIRLFWGFLIFGKFEKKWILTHFFKFYLPLKTIFREPIYRIWLEKEMKTNNYNKHVLIIKYQFLWLLGKAWWSWIMPPWKSVWRPIEINSSLASKFIEKINYSFTIYESWMVASGHFKIISISWREELWIKILENIWVLN